MFNEMPINAGYEYMNAEKKYGEAQTLEERIVALEEMIKTAPKHKGSENLLSELRTRLKKFLEKKEKNKKTGKGKAGIKKEGYQVALVGLANSGKSSLLSVMTNARPKISEHAFSTKEPMLGTMDYEGVKAQMVDVPSIGSSGFDIGVVNNADCLLLVVDKIEDIAEVEKHLNKSVGMKINVIMKVDLLGNEGRRKLEERCRAKRLNGVFFSAITKEGTRELGKRIFDNMNVIRVYMKEPGKKATNIPAVLKEGSNVKDAAEGILKGFYLRVKETKVTGPSAKFANQKVGLQHVLKDRDVIEFHTR